MKNNIKYTKEMYEYLVWCFFNEINNILTYDLDEDVRINKFVKDVERKLTKEQKKIIDNKVLRMQNEYEECIMYSLEKRYGFYDRSYFDIDYNDDFYELWKSAVVKRRTVKLVYDSTTSGKTTRLVDPYKTNAPYGEGYCHNKKEVRKFRFDRVIDIEMTDEKFIK